MYDSKLDFRARFKRNRCLWLMALPAIIVSVIMSYIPMTGIVLAFKNYDYSDGFFSDWVGLDNFKFFFQSGKAFTVTRNTIIFNLMFIVFGKFFEIFVAIIISELGGKYFKKICQSVIILPYFVSWVTAAAFVYNIFGYETGIVNTVLTSFGMERLNIYTSTNLWYFILPMVYIWKDVGYGSILYLSAIMGLDQECYEAAMIDGANRFQKIIHITIPGIMPTIILLLLLSLGKILRGNFDMFYQLIGANSMLYETTDIIDVYVYRSLVEQPNIGMTSAITLFQSVVCFVTIVIVNTIVKRYQADYSLF